VNDANTNVEVKADPSNPKPGFQLPLFPMPGIFGGIAVQDAERAKEHYEKMKAASGEIVDILRETNAKGAADYGAKVIEISSVNATSAFDFLTHLMGTRSLSEIVQLSATHGRKNFETTSAQSKELWELARKVATETAEPIKKSLTKVLQKAS
jgi:phasin